MELRPSLHRSLGRLASASSVLALVLALSACGGGSDDPAGEPGPAPGPVAGTPAAPAALDLGYGLRSFSFEWEAVAGATSYRLLEDPDGQSGYAVLAEGLAGTRHDHVLDVLLHERLNARYAVQACNAAGCGASSPVATPDVNRAIGFIKASNTGGGDEFGGAIALSADGSTLAVGARLESTGTPGVQAGAATGNEDAQYSGAVYVFRRSDGRWAQEAFVKPAHVDPTDEFGFSVALSGDGNVLAVGARGESGSQAGVFATQPPDDDTLTQASAAYVFRREAGTWTQQAFVKPFNPGNGDSFGYAVALDGDGDTLVVGSPGEDSNLRGVFQGTVTPNELAGNAGAAYVFSRTGDTWAPQAFVKATNAGASDLFGVAVALSADGNLLAVGASAEDGSLPGVRTGSFDDVEGQPNSGAAYLFTRNAATWSHAAYVKASEPEAGEEFGRSLAIAGDGNTFVVGAPNEGSDRNGIFTTPPADNDAAQQSGAVYVFARTGADWTQQAFIKGSNTAAIDQFGVRVALSHDGATLLVGAHWQPGVAAGILPGSNFDDPRTAQDSVGAAYVFRRGTAGWSQQAGLKPSWNDGYGVQFGTSVAVSGDGRTAAVGALYDRSAATGIQPQRGAGTASSAGAVYLF